MTNIIHNYPKTSCDCDDKDNVKDNVQNVGFQTNSGYSGCNFPNSKGENYIFRSHAHPRNKSGDFNVLNPQIFSGVSREFEKVNCKDGSSTYTSADPRLTNTIRNHHLLLDTPPLVSTQKEDFRNIYTDQKLDNYGRGYKSYSDIGAGNIVYYTTTDREDPFHSPLFTIPAHTTGHIHVTPMDAVRPEYNRTVKKQNMLRPPLPETVEQDGGLSWLRDSAEHREDILALQMRRRNRERWMPRWNDESGM